MSYILAEALRTSPLTNDRSWKSIFLTLSSGDLHRLRIVTPLLHEDRVFDLLTNSLDQPPPANSTTRSTFDTLTSAINVTPTRNDRYDIKQIKENALWLSKTVKVDEVQALRLTILEWQQSTSVQLAEGDAEDERALAAFNDAVSPLKSFFFIYRGFS